MSLNESDVEHPFYKKLYQELMAEFGPLIPSRELPRLLAFPSPEAFRRACSRNALPIPIYKIQQRRGRFVMTEDVAKWVTSVKIYNKVKEVTDG